MNPMREIKVIKVTLNMGVGGEATKLEKCSKLLEGLTGVKATKTSSNKRIPSWGVRPNLAIACKVTVRGKDKINSLLKRLFEAVENQLQEKKFDIYGNLSFGIDEYINIPGVEYDVELGIVGMDIAITLERPGNRVKRRFTKSTKIGKNQKITKEEAIAFIKEKFNVEVLEK